MFKSQNARTWEPDQLSDLSFIIHQCAFNTAGNVFTDVDAKINNLPKQYVDYMKVSAPYETYTKDTSISFSLATTANGDSGLSAGKPIYPGSDVYFETRQQFVGDDEAI